jgi:hypothetical protein
MFLAQEPTTGPEKPRSGHPNPLEPSKSPARGGATKEAALRMKIDPLAESILTELSQHPASGQIVLGGYFALRHHVNYRTTHDFEAWWRTRADAQAEAGIRAAMQKVASDKGLLLSERRFGETVSFELSQGKSKVFSFQIAVRSVELEPPQASAWPPILIETLADNVASKMTALVDRGSPRDFTDIYQVVTAGLQSIAKCWTLWEKKNPGEQCDQSKQKVLLHLAALEQRRPESGIADPNERERASIVRRWFREEFCRQ